jgi:hypothetical protein
MVSVRKFLLASDVKLRIQRKLLHELRANGITMLMGDNSQIRYREASSYSQCTRDGQRWSKAHP